MPIHAGARLYSFVHALFGSKDKAETYRLYQQVMELYEAANLSAYNAKQWMTDRVTRSVSTQLDLAANASLRDGVPRFIERVVEYEQLFEVPAVDWAQKRSTTGWWLIRDDLLRHKLIVQDLSETKAVLAELLTELLKPIAAN